jgi:hypothetical protein
VRGHELPLIALAVTLLIGHGFLFYYAGSYIAISATTLAGIALLVVLKHLGLLGALLKVVARRRKRDGP